MRQNYRIALALTVASLMAPVAFAGYVDVTIADPHPGKTFNPGTPGASGQKDPSLPENNQVGWNAIANQSWDLESFKFDAATSNLKMTGGFNFTTGYGFNGDGKTTSLYNTHYAMGDIFLYVGDVPYTATTGWPGSKDWDFAIVFERDTAGNIQVGDNNVVKYAVTSKNPSLPPTTPVNLKLTGGSASLHAGLPWQLEGVTEFGYEARYSSSSYSQASNPNTWENEIYDINLSDILASLSVGETVYAHTTMGCGNDVMWGKVQSVPDGGTTLVLLGSGLVGLAFLRRRIA